MTYKMNAVIKYPFIALGLCATMMLTLSRNSSSQSAYATLNANSQSAYATLNTSGQSTDVSYSVISRPKTILLWRNATGYRFFPLGRSAFIDKACAVTNCLITDNSTLVADMDFDALLIYPPAQAAPPPQLKRRRPDQLLVMFSLEPPAHMPSLSAYGHYFNRTMSYRRDSDFYLPYGQLVPLASAPSSAAEVMGLRRRIRASGVNPAAGKSRSTVWMVSNCHAESNRQEYVARMQRFMHVDIFSTDGSCGGVDGCARPTGMESVGSDCHDLVERQYKFYLAFENSICDEYVTEKFFDMIGRNIVPVVLGGADYASLAPPHSYINALHYTPEQLALYLQRLDADDALYAEYFWWKPHYRVRNLMDTNRQAFCDLCAALHAQSVRHKTVDDVHRWFIADSHCRHHPQF